MRSFEIFVAPRESEPLPAPVSGIQSELAPEPAPSSAPRLPRRAASEVLDIFIGGANVTALVAAAHRPGKGQPTPTAASIGGVLRDLGVALVDLSRSPRGKRLVRFYDDPWELCVERWGSVALLSVYRGGADPVVAVHDRVVPFDEVRASASEAIAGLMSRGTTPPALAIELRGVAEELASGCPLTELSPGEAGGVPAPSAVDVDKDDGAPLSLSAELFLREGARATCEPSVERTDMHALLFRGRVVAHVRDRDVDLGEGHPFLLAEHLVSVARSLLDAWERGSPHQLRVDAAGVLIGARLGHDGVLALTLGSGSGARKADAVHTFPALSVKNLVDASLAFGRGVVRALLRRDRSQSGNLRVSAFRRQLREMESALREASRDDARTNPSPESYRAFATARRGGGDGGAPPERGAARVEPPTRLRYAARWRALVPGIDLRSTFLCGERLIVGGLDETFAIHRATGEVLWRIPTQKATSVVTPGGIARLRADGELCIHDFGTGDVTLRSWLAPRAFGPPAGAVVNIPGLPRLLILTEGERHLVALDLTSGEPRWRFAWGRKGSLRLKRAGKLVYYTSGDSALTALDVLTGSIVWRARDRLRFRTPPTLDHDVLFAVAGGAGSRANLHAIDAFSGQPRWTARVATDHDTCTVEGGAHAVGDAVVVAVREGHTLRLVGFERETGARRWVSPQGVAPAGTSWLAVDDLLIGNSPTGELLALEARTGELRYRHVLGTVLETDVPRKLEPVLRSGALFVPHSNVHVFRPRDGAEIGVIGPCEAIPDLLRVDERCDVYIAEESGHVVSFAAGPRLSLVKS
jgi:outer membrane protein assembly factor BamB